MKRFIIIFTILYQFFVETLRQAQGPEAGEASRRISDHFRWRSTKLAFSHIKFWLVIGIIFSNAYAFASSSNVVVAPNQAKLEINGAVCAYCAYGMQKGLSKMECVDSSQGHKGVESDIENQIITIHLKEGKEVDLKEMSEKIRKSGYEPRTFHMRVQGELLFDGKQKFIVNTRKEKLYELQGELSDTLVSAQNYDLQLLINEDAIQELKNNQLPKAEVHTIIKGE